MSWRSLYAIDNPNGRIGSTTTATPVSITAVVGGAANIAPIQNLASFTSLPVGVYSVSVSVPLANTAGTATIADNWIIGASASASTAAFIYGQKAIINFPTTIAVETATPTLVTDFILNVPSVSTPTTIYINSSFINGSAANNAQLSWAGTTSPGIVIVATKMA